MLKRKNKLNTKSTPTQPVYLNQVKIKNDKQAWKTGTQDFTEFK